MKKRLITITATAVLLAGCSANGGLDLNSGMNMGHSLVKTAVDNQCRSELNNRNEWRLIALAMTAEKQREWEDKICGCASEEALNQMSAADMVAVANPNTRTQTVANVTAKTVTACFQRLYR
ncbi:PBP1b-binding outer membrane lipoprotein LpoB [Neisseria sp. HSC-16F19]|nr:hypothetical protein [Neisseria sp. HSC-16F19]MCP2039778.1 PBP1b-binding outer membrane lipoprotein LpoB [Neisseria sp. HSC-16F19]